MNVVIPYTHERDHGEELRYAIRSMVKYFTPLEDIILVGDAPDFYVGQYIPCPDIKGRKELSIYNKLMQVHPQTVLYSNDDYFALKAFDEELPNYCSGKLCKDKKTVDADYRRLYEACPGAWMDFDVHTPMIIDTSKFNWEDDKPIKTYYANQNRIAGQLLPDLKIRGVRDYGSIKQLINGRPFFSTNGNIKAGGMMQVMNELYPVKSKYEL
jgi:hypothetical protein